MVSTFFEGMLCGLLFMSLVVSAGCLKGRRIKAPSGARPTTSRARLAIFNSLQNYISDLNNQESKQLELLDLCAGSGLWGFECMSRLKLRERPVKATFVDITRDSCHAIRKNAQELGVADDVVIKKTCAHAFVLASKECFDFIFLPEFDTSGC